MCPINQDMCLINQASRSGVVAILAAFAMAGAGMSAANAQQTETPNASAFLANPGRLLQQNPDGRSVLADAVQQLAVSDSSTFRALIGSEQQKGAIAQGLTLPAKTEVLADQTRAPDWENQVAAFTDPSFKTAASDALGDVKLGSIGGAAGGMEVRVSAVQRLGRAEKEGKLSGHQELSLLPPLSLLRRIRTASVAFLTTTTLKGM